MALNVVQKLTTDEDVFPSLRFEIFDIAIDNNYPAGGWSGVRALTGMNFLLAFLLIGRPDTSTGNGFFLQYNSDTDKLHMYYMGGALNGWFAEAAGGTNANWAVCRFLAIGK